jgi:filamentous hemagglutinin family protein
MANAARANPTGGQVVSGAATITTAPGAVTINQATTTASINWQDFSIASGETTRFQVPTSLSATLNRVTGGNISTIYGTLSSNGRLYLINPNGIVIGAGGKVDTAGFLATTLNFSDTEFNQQANLTLNGNSTAGVSNAGSIHASTGDVYLIAAQVNNSGTISAPKGTVGLAAGNSVLLQKAGDQHLFVQVNGATRTTATGVTNSGAIRAAAAELKAAGGNAYALAINNSGNIKATGIKTINGQVYLTSDGGNISNSGTIYAKQANGNGGTIVVNAHHNKTSTTGTVLNSGTIAATGTAAGSKGGTVELLGDCVGVMDGGVVNVSGSAGGGTALIGGDEHGANAAVPDAEQTYIAPDATINADALTLGSGGKVIVWGNETTQVYGAITARGGTAGGDGGFVETSAAVLDVQKAADVSAANGKGGTWLLDPSDVTISDNVSTTDSGFTGTPAFTITSGTVTISQATLLTALENGNVTIAPVPARADRGRSRGTRRATR